MATHRKSQGLGAKCRMVEKEEVRVYILILHTLQALLQNETVISEVSMKQITMCLFRLRGDTRPIQSSSLTFLMVPISMSTLSSVPIAMPCNYCFTTMM